MGYNLPLDVELSTQRSISAICSGHTASVIRHLNGGIVSHQLLRMSNGSSHVLRASPLRKCQIMADAIETLCMCSSALRHLCQTSCQTSISGCSQRFWGFMRQDDHQYNIELVPKWEVCKVPSCPYASMCFPEAYYWKSGWEAICARSGVIFRIHHT